MKYKYCFTLLFFWVQLFVSAQNFDGRKINPKSSIIAFDSKSENIYDVIKNAPPNSTIYFNKNEELVIKKPIVIDKPLTLIGLNAMLPEGLGKTSIVEVNSKDVSIFDFKLKGNTGSVEQIERAPLIRICKSNFHVERCLFEDSSKDGVEISPLANSEDIDGGVVRNIVGRNCVRDVISINGSHGEKSTYIRNILVEDIRGYDSSLRGPVEVSDGSENITVRKIYAENCVYAVDWQDHNRPAEINKNTLIDDVYALNCKYAIRNAVHDFGHTNLTLTNIIAEKCQEPLKIANTSNVIVRNVRILDHRGDKNPFLAINCNDLTIQNLTIVNSDSDKEGVLIENCDEVLIDGISFSGEVKKLSCGIAYHITKNRGFKNLRITNVSAINLHNEGIILRSDKNTTLDNYIITGNISKVKDLINGDKNRIDNNL